MTISTSFLVLEAELAGGAPWDVMDNDVTARHGNPIWHLKGANKAISVLMLHGEKDELIPLSQATGFHTACMDLKVDAQLVIYPREGHQILERVHRIDMLKRIKKFLDEKLA